MDCYEHGNGPLGSNSGWKFLDQPTITLTGGDIVFHEVATSLLENELYNRIIIIIKKNYAP
jgi:hypothetical protein